MLRGRGGPTKRSPMSTSFAARATEAMRQLAQCDAGTLAANCWRAA